MTVKGKVNMTANAKVNKIIYEQEHGCSGEKCA